ncbi:unnamed protein product, partial [Rotaria sordida]
MPNNTYGNEPRFYNNQHKYIARRMFDRVLLDGLDINLSE